LANTLSEKSSLINILGPLRCFLSFRTAFLILWLANFATIGSGLLDEFLALMVVMIYTVVIMVVMMVMMRAVAVMVVMTIRYHNVPKNNLLTFSLQNMIPP
jgi:uncharacterized membrane protein YccC